MRPPAALAIVGIFAPALAFAGDTEWRRYVIPSTGTSVDMPVSIFTSDAGRARERNRPTVFHRRPPRRSDGAVRSQSRRTIHPPRSWPSKQPPAGIIYKRITSDFFVVSSIRKDRIWYNRCNRGNGTMNCVLINYPAARGRLKAEPGDSFSPKTAAPI